MGFIVNHFRIPGAIYDLEEEGAIYKALIEVWVDSAGVIQKVIADRAFEDDNEELPIEIEKEFIRVFNLMPKWNPAYKKDRYVNAQVYIPLRFTLFNNTLEIYNIGYQAIAGQSNKTRPIRLAIGILGVTIIAIWTFMIINRAISE